MLEHTFVCLEHLNHIAGLIYVDGIEKMATPYNRLTNVDVRDIGDDLTDESRISAAAIPIGLYRDCGG